MEAYLEYIVNRRPTLTSVDVTGEDVGTRPTVTYTWNDADGDVQNRNQVKVFPTAMTSLAGFSPDTSKPIYDSGEQATNAAEHIIGQDMPPGVALTAYVRAAHQVGDLGLWWTVWSSVNFTIVLAQPATPVLTMGPYDGGFDRALLLLQGRNNMLDDNDSSFETTVGSWVVDTNVTSMVRSTAAPFIGLGAGRATFTGAGVARVKSGPYVALAGKTYGVGGRSRANATSRTFTVEIRYYSDTAGTTQIGSFASAGVAETVGAYTTFQTASGLAPATTQRMRIFAVWGNGAASEVHDIDALVISPGGAPPAFSPGGQETNVKYELQYVDMVRSGNVTHPNIASGGEFFDNTDGWYPRTGADTIDVSTEVPPYDGKACIRWVASATSSILDVGSRLDQIDPYVWAAKGGELYEGGVRVRTFVNTWTVRVFFRFLDGNGLVLGSLDSGNTVFGDSWLDIIPPEGVAPAGTVMCRLEIQNQSGLSGFPIFIDTPRFGDSPELTPRHTIGMGRLLEWRPWRNSIDLETGRVDALFHWNDFQAQQENTFHDYEVPVREFRLYRLRATLLQGTVDTASSWTPVVMVDANLAQNWLKDVFNPRLNFVPRINGLRPMSRGRALRRGVHEIIGRSTPVVLTSKPSSEQFNVQIVIENEADWHRWEAMLLGQGPLLLRTPTRQWYVQALGEPEELDYTVRVRGGDGYYRAYSVDFVEQAIP
jgi:hypothetical protein